MDWLEQFLRESIYKSLSSVLEFSDVPCGDKGSHSPRRWICEWCRIVGSELSFKSCGLKQNLANPKICSEYVWHRKPPPAPPWGMYRDGQLGNCCLKLTDEDRMTKSEKQGERERIQITESRLGLALNYAAYAKCKLSWQVIRETRDSYISQ